MNIHNKITNGFLWIVCLSIGWTSCSEKTDALHFNEAEQVFEISKLSELHYLSKLTEDNPLLIDVNLKTKTGKEIPATQARIKLINDIEISGKWTPINAPIKELNGNGHTIIFDDVEFIVEDSEKSFFYYFGLFGELGTKENLVNFTQGIQASSPIDSFVRVLPAPMPGYPFDEVMAAGSFTQGSTIELSADAPMVEPYTLYMQGGLTFEYGKLSILLALTNMKNNDQ